VFCPANYVIAADLKPSCFKLRDCKNAVGEPRISIGTHFEFDACPAFFVGFRPGRGFVSGCGNRSSDAAAGLTPLYKAGLFAVRAAKIRLSESAQGLGEVWYPARPVALLFVFV
jgi:hypothetical protein